MSLDVSLRTPVTTPADECVCPHCKGHGQVGGDEVFTLNITHNLGHMAYVAGLYQAIWRPDQYGYTYAKDLIDPLTRGLAVLLEDRARFELCAPRNGWGTYDGLVSFTQKYLQACKDNSECTVHVSR